MGASRKVTIEVPRDLLRRAHHDVSLVTRDADFRHVARIAGLKLIC